MKIKIVIFIFIYCFGAVFGKISVRPGFTRNLLDVIGNWLDIAGTNMGDWYKWSHQCNWPLINKIVLNCPKKLNYENSNKLNQIVISDDIILEPANEEKSRKALKIINDFNSKWSFQNVALMSLEERSNLFKKCFKNDFNFLSCIEKAWTEYGMNMCEVYNHAYNYNDFCKNLNSCYCMTISCNTKQINDYNNIIDEDQKINSKTGLPLDWNINYNEKVKKEWCDINYLNNNNDYLVNYNNKVIHDSNGNPLRYGVSYYIINNDNSNEYMAEGATGSKDSVQVVSTFTKKNALIFQLCRSLNDCSFSGGIKEYDSFYAYSASTNRWLDDYYGYIVLDRREDTDPIYYFTLKQCKDDKNCKISSSHQDKWIFRKWDSKYGGYGYFYTTPWNSMYFQFYPEY